LDPESSLLIEHAESVCAAGWQIKKIRSVEEIHLHDQGAKAIALRLTHGTRTLLELKEQLERTGQPIDVICRIDRNAFALGIQANAQTLGMALAHHIIEALEQSHA